MLMQATAGLRALKGDASDRILQAVMFFSCSLETIFMFPYLMLIDGSLYILQGEGSPERQK